MSHSRRSFIQALAATGGGMSSFAQLDAAMAQAAAQQVTTGPVPPLQFLSPNWPDYVEISRLLVASWSKLGLAVEARQGTTQSVLAEVIGEHKMPHVVGVSWGGAPDRIDPDYFLTEFFHSRRAMKGGLNYGHYRNPAYDEIADAQRREMDPQKRRNCLVMRTTDSRNSSCKGTL